LKKKRDTIMEFEKRRGNVKVAKAQSRRRRVCGRLRFDAEERKSIGGVLFCRRGGAEC